MISTIETLTGCWRVSSPPLAAYERELKHERAAAVRLRGWHTGRPSGLTAAQARRVRSLRADGEPVSDPMRTLGVSRATAYRALQQADDAEPPLPSVGTAPA